MRSSHSSPHHRLHRARKRGPHTLLLPRSHLWTLHWSRSSPPSLVHSRHPRPWSWRASSLRSCMPAMTAPSLTLRRTCSPHWTAWQENRWSRSWSGPRYFQVGLHTAHIGTSGALVSPLSNNLMCLSKTPEWWQNSGYWFISFLPRMQVCGPVVPKTGAAMVFAKEGIILSPSINEVKYTLLLRSHWASSGQHSTPVHLSSSPRKLRLTLPLYNTLIN